MYLVTDDEAITEANDSNYQKYLRKAQCTKGKYTLETTMRKQNNQSR